jgi:hypothetical protein
MLSNEAIDDLSLPSSAPGSGAAEPVATNPDRDAGRR